MIQILWFDGLAAVRSGWGMKDGVGRKGQEQAHAQQDGVLHSLGRIIKVNGEFIPLYFENS